MKGAALHYKLFAGFGAVLCLLVLVGGVGLRNTTEFASALTSLHQNQLVPLAELRHAEAAFYELRLGGLSYAQVSRAGRDAIRTDETRWLNEVEDHFQAYLASNLEEEELEVLPSWEQLYPAYLASRARTMALHDQGLEAEARLVLDTEAAPEFDEAHAALAKLIAIQESQAAQIDRRVTNLAEKSSRLLLAAVLLALAIGLALAGFVSRRVAGLHAASEKRRREAEALASDLDDLRRHNEALLCSAGDGIYGLDLDGRTTFVNPTAARLLGYEADELLGTLQHELLHHTRPDGTAYPLDECPIYAAFKDGTVREGTEDVFWRKDGTSFPVEYTSTPMLERGQPVGAVVTFRDVTRRRDVEVALRESKARLQRESDRLLALHRASAVLAAQTAEPDAVLDEVLRSAVSLIGASSGSLYRWNAEEGVLRCVRNFRVASTHHTSDVRPPHGLAGQAFTRGQPVLVNDYRTWEFASDSARIGDMRAGIGVPLMRSGKGWAC